MADEKKKEPRKLHNNNNETLQRAVEEIFDTLDFHGVTPRPAEEKKDGKA